MESMVKEISISEWTALAHSLGEEFSKRVQNLDDNDTFVHENYGDLKNNGVLEAMIPKELGGGGISHTAMCEFLQILAQYCGSTALALSMHQHLVAANVWKYRHQKGGETLLRKVAQQQLVLVSTGAKDWLESNGEVKKTEDGFEVTAMKHFASQSPVGDILVTSAPYKDPEDGWQVIHFSIPFDREGVSLLDNWYTMGMRSTGSHTVKLENVFVPESDIVLRRPQGTYHQVWNVVLTVALPLISSVYVGIAKQAVEKGIKLAQDKKEEKPHLAYLVGEMHNALTTAQVLCQDMVRLTNNFVFEPNDETGNAILTRKTLVANACINAVTKAMEVVGGRSFFRDTGLERLFRDVQAGAFHPLPEKEQQLFSGRFLLDVK